MRNTEFMFVRTQDLPESFYDAGQMYFLNVESFKKQHKIFMEKNYPIIIDAIDVDKFEDWEQAEYYYRIKHE
jgi:pseudaminic acid cytidylyltransferase